MTTKQEMIEIIKLENIVLQSGSDDKGYITLSDNEYETTIESWAEAKLARQQRDAEKKQLRSTKIAAYTKLGLTGEEIEALIPTHKPIIRD